MPLSDLDKVQLEKQESGAGGGDPADEDEWCTLPLEPQEDAPEVRGIFMQPEAPDPTDMTTGIYRDGNDLIFTDAANSPTEYTLTQLISGSLGDNPDSLFNELNESFDVLITETDCIPTSILAHAPGAPATKIREIDNFSCDALGILNGLRVRQFAGDGTTVLETMTYNGTGWVKS